MDCNKDEALRAKELAEKKLIEKDIAGAKRFASKAQCLFPGLEGLPQFEEVLDVYVASERKVNGDVDWYGVIGADPLADDDTIRKKYRKLALSLHPDKNKCVGAEGAFKLLSEAWSFLSDKGKKAAYDQNQNIRVSRDKVQGSNPKTGVMENGYKKVRLSTSKYPATQEYNVDRDSAPCQSSPRTFWTSCRRCNMQYEYLIMYLNQNLICPNCRLPFIAIEMPPPQSAQIGKLFRHWPFNQQKQGGKKHFDSAYHSKRKFPPTGRTRGNSRVPSVRSTKEVHISHGSSSIASGGGSVSTPSGAACQPAYAGQNMVWNQNKVHEDSCAGEFDEVALKKKSALKKTYPGLASENTLNSRKGESLPKKRRLKQQSALGSKNPGLVSGEAIISRSKVNSSMRDFSPSESCTVLMGRAKLEILNNIEEWRMTASLKNMKGKRTGEGNQLMHEDAEESVFGITKKVRNMRCAHADGNVVQSRVPPFSLSESVPVPNQLYGSCLSAPTTVAGIKATEMMVTIPEFYDFDKDRSEESFSENQVWALYDAKDGMPRYYALINGLISKDPFQVRISWLSFESSNLSLLKWVNCGFPSTSGNFRVGKCEVIKNLISFSHQVKCSKDARGLIHIFPMKGDVWVLYRNWSSDWNELTPDDVIRQYDVVEVLEDYNHEQGVLVVPLVKVAAFKAVFHQHLDPRTIYRIPKEELCRFSHQVPSDILRGNKVKRALKGCRELDPAAMPVEFLEVMSEAEEEEVEGTLDAEDIEMLAEVPEGGRTSGYRKSDTLMVLLL